MVQVYFTDMDKVGQYIGTEPIPLQDVKDHLYIEGTQDDALLGRMIGQCRASIENFCHISLVDKTVTLTIQIMNAPQLLFRGYSSRDSPYYEFGLPDGPIISVDSVTSIDVNNNLQVLALNQDYWVSGKDFKKIRISNSFTNNIIIYQTGYEIVPEDLILAMLNEIAFRFENRGDGTNRYASQKVGISESSQYLAQPYQRQSWQ